MASEEPLMMPRPDERQARTAAKKSGLLKAPPQQAAFAAQNLEDMLIYDTDRYRTVILSGICSLQCCGSGCGSRRAKISHQHRKICE